MRWLCWIKAAPLRLPWPARNPVCVRGCGLKKGLPSPSRGMGSERKQTSKASSRLQKMPPEKWIFDEMQQTCPEESVTFCLAEKAKHDSCEVRGYAFQVPGGPGQPQHCWHLRCNGFVRMPHPLIFAHKLLPAFRRCRPSLRRRQRHDLIRPHAVSKALRSSVW